MKRLLVGLSLLVLAASANAKFFNSNNGEWKMGPYGPYWDESNWPEWTPMYWMEEMADSFDDNNNSYGYGGGMPFMGGGYPGMMPYAAPMMPYAAPMPPMGYGAGYAPAPMPFAPMPALPSYNPALTAPAPMMPAPGATPGPATIPAPAANP